MSVLERDFLEKAKNNVIFVLIYTVLFVFIYKTFPYIAPFFIGGIIAFIISPVSEKLKNKFNIDKGVSTLILSFLAVALVITLTSFFVINITKQSMTILNNISDNPQNINAIMTNIINHISVYIEHFQDISNFNIDEVVTKYSGNIINILKNLLYSVVNLATSIPYIMIFIITLFISTYFIAKDIDKIENNFYNMFTQTARQKVKGIKKETILSIVGYIKAYTILMGITFVAIWISFSLFKVPYAMPLGIIGAILDLIPFLGIIVIYLPVIAYYFIIKNYFAAVSILVLFIALSLLRQVLEPKLVSVNVGLSPLSTLAAIFIGVQVKGIIGIIFCLGLVCMRDILKKVDIL